MGFRSSTRVRLSGVAVLAAMVAGCGGGDNAPVTPPAPPPASQLLDWGVHPAASAVLGQANLESADAAELGALGSSPTLTAEGLLYVAAGNLKGFLNYAAGGATAQKDVSFAGSVTGVFAQGNKIVVAHAHRLAIYNSAATVDQAPDLIFDSVRDCGPKGMNGPQGVHLTSSGHLIVADSGNHRVLIWTPDQVLQAGELPEPKVVLGQENKGTCAVNAGGGTESLSEFTMNEPSSVWSDGTRLLVADTGNNRILIWDSIPTDDFQPADHVLGQADFDDNLPNRGQGASEITLCSPRSVDVNEFGQLAVADSCNHRVLVWNAIPSEGSVPANHVIGQSTFTGNDPPTAPTARNLKFPSGARFHNRNLIVVDREHSRVLVFPASN